MRRTSELLVVVTLSLLAVGLAASPVSAVEQAQNPTSLDVGTNCECFDSGGGGGGDDGGGGGGGGHLEPALDGGFLFHLDDGSGGNDGGGGGHLEP